MEEFSSNACDGQCATINMTVKDDSSFLSAFSQSDFPVISSDVADFIENATSSVYPGKPIKLQIHSSCIDDLEKDVYEKAIRRYYREKNSANERELKRNKMIILFLLIAGVAVLALSIFLSAMLSSEVVPGVIDIFAWVLVWEAADIGFFKNSELRVNKKRYNSFINMEIVYF